MKDYDLINDLSLDIKENYSLAKTLMEEGDFSKAIRILEKMYKEDARILLVKASLAEAYFKNNNSGKALKMYEELTAVEPENAVFAGNLGPCLSK